MNNIHLCGWTLNAKPVSSVSREADAAVVKSMPSAERKMAENLRRSLAILMMNGTAKSYLLFPSHVATDALHTSPHRCCLQRISKQLATLGVWAASNGCDGTTAGGLVRDTYYVSSIGPIESAELSLCICKSPCLSIEM